MAIIKNISRLSELKIFSKIVEGMKTIVAFNKKNYSLDVEEIKGSKIAEITEDVASGDSRRNTIAVKLEDGTRFPFYVYDGSQGDQGTQGETGVKGDKGKSGEVSAIRSKNSLMIVNDNETKATDKVWAAYRGKTMYDEIRSMSETFVTEDEYDLLWNNIIWMNAEFTTTKDDEDVVLFNSDTNDHTLYHKFWTYEDSDVSTYYVAIYDNDGNITRYDTVSANLWDDVYQGEKSGYFESTSSQLTDGSALYYYDDNTKSYKPVELIYTETSDGPVYVGNKELDYYVKSAGTYVHADYSTSSKSWTYNLLASELPIIVYKTDDGETFTLVDVDDISTSSTAKYYSAANMDSLIEDIKSYIATPSTRYYVLGSTETSHTHNGVTSTSKYEEVKSLSSIDTAKFQEYIVTEYDTLNNEYTITHYYPVTIKKVEQYAVSSKTLTNSSITLYSYMGNREYYTSAIETHTDESGNVTYDQVYTKITVPFWMYAQFQTDDEDELTLILNTNVELGDGKEDDFNKVEDTTAEETETEEESIPITQVIFGDVPEIYYKDSHNNYVEFDFETETISENTTYYTKDDELNYVAISGDDALDLPSGSIIYKLSAGVYTVTNETIVSTETYYKGEVTYTAIDDIDALLHNASIILFNGEPQQVYVNIFPSTATNKSMEMTYDPDKVTLYEDGRIAAVANNCETDIVLTTDDGSNITSTLHIVLTMPMKTITLKSDVSRINIGGTAKVTGTYFPASTSNTAIDFNMSDDNIASVTYENNVATVTGKASGTVRVLATANDTYGANASTNIEVIQPATAINWNQDNIETVHHNEVLWTTSAAEDENYNHLKDKTDASKGYEEGYTPVNEGDVRTAAYDEYNMTILMGVDYELNPEVLPEDTSYPTISWESSDSKNVKVTSATRTVTITPAVTHEATQQDIDDNKASELGETVVDTAAVTSQETYYVINGAKATSTPVVVTAKITIGQDNDNPLTQTLNVTVKQAVEQITLSPSSIEFNVATKKLLSLTITPSEDAITTHTVESEDTSICTVTESNSGLELYGVSSGKTKIKVSALDGSGVVGICNVTVTVPAKDIIVTGQDVNGIVYVGIDKTTALETIITYNKTELADTDIHKAVSWSSSNPDIATVDENGVVTGVDIVDGKNDTTIIAAAADGSGVFGTIKVYVIRLVTEITFDETEINMNTGDSYVLVPNFAPIDASNEVVIWKSSDETVATVNDGGIITALKAGETTITAETTDGSELTASCTVTITE